MDVLTPVGALGIIGGRLGNIMNGRDTGGRLTDWGIGFAWPKPDTPFMCGIHRLRFIRHIARSRSQRWTRCVSFWGS